MHTKFLTNSGFMLDVSSDKYDISLEDIAKGLSSIFRNAGQAPLLVSVAEHCLLVSDLIKLHAPTAYYVQLFGLLHDCDEVLTRDIPSGVKNDIRIKYLGNEDFGRCYRDNILSSIFSKFGLNNETISLMREHKAIEAVKAEDNLAYYMEMLAQPQTIFKEKMLEHIKEQETCRHLDDSELDLLMSFEDRLKRLSKLTLDSRVKYVKETFISQFKNIIGHLQ